MTYLINTLSVLAAMFIWCNLVGYLGARLSLYLDNQAVEANKQPAVTTSSETVET
jgi:hypothetical protein